jgi:hypothetical protein
MNPVLQKELASLNRDFAAVSERLRRINDLVYELQDDRPRPRTSSRFGMKTIPVRDINISSTAPRLDSDKPQVNRVDNVAVPDHTFIGGACFCPPRMRAVHG